MDQIGHGLAAVYQFITCYHSQSLKFEENQEVNYNIL